MAQRTQVEADCIKTEMEYRSWKENSLWYCVKTLFNMANGKMESDFIRDEKTKLPITIKSDEKPLDGVFEDVQGTTYYTYFGNYAEAARQIAAAKA